MINKAVLLLNYYYLLYNYVLDITKLYIDDEILYYYT